MADFESFESMVIAKVEYEKLCKEQFASYVVKDNIFNECQDAENKFYNCLINTELNRIFTPNMTANDKKIKCYNEIVDSEKEYVAKQKLSMKAFSDYLRLKEIVYK